MNGCLLFLGGLIFLIYAIVGENSLNASPATCFCFVFAVGSWLLSEDLTNEVDSFYVCVLSCMIGLVVFNYCDSLLYALFCSFCATILSVIVGCLFLSCDFNNKNKSEH